MKITTKIISAILVFLMLMIPACGEKKTADTNENVPAVNQNESSVPNESSDSAESDESEENVKNPPDDAELVDNPSADITDNNEESESESASESESESESESSEPERIYSYLNGKTVTEEEQQKRPVAVMINNIKNCLPQDGITKGDIYYECAAEGGITRIMMLTSDYEDIEVIGPVRSSRDYFVDFIANHDAIYVHAGGSDASYEKIIWRKIQNLDGVNQYTPSTFWRDPIRRQNQGYEHSLMTSGEGIVSGINYFGYRTELDENQVPMFKFYDEETDNTPVGSPATHVHMISTSIQTVDFVYDKETGEYLRYQYDGMPQVEASTGEQLSVKNVIILFTDISLIPGDEAGRLSVGTVGSGQGYYITNGQRKVIKWSRETKTSTVHLEYRNGGELILNCGKTFICVVDNSVASKIDFEYEW